MTAFLKMLGEAGYTGPIGLQGYGVGGDARDNLTRSMQAWKKHSRVLYGDVAPFGPPKEQ